MTANVHQADGTPETVGGRDVPRYERRLSHGILRWELEADGDASRLVFTASYPEKDAETRLSLLGGWHIHLDHLADALDGSPQDWSRWMDEQLPRWQEHHDRYAARLSARSNRRRP